MCLLPVGMDGHGVYNTEHMGIIPHNLKKK